MNQKDAAIVLRPIDQPPPIDVPDVVWRMADFCHAPISSHAHHEPGCTFECTLPESMHKAVPKRRAEYLAGRLCAGHGLSHLGYPPAVSRNGRVPIWPEGVVGSISHTDHLAIAVVSDRHAGLGVDVENIMKPDQLDQISQYVMSDAERALQPSDMEAPVFITLVFSAKEAVFKAAFARVRKLSGFAEGQVLAVTDQHVVLAYSGVTYTCHWVRQSDQIISFVAIGLDELD